MTAAEWSTSSRAPAHPERQRRPGARRRRACVAAEWVRDFVRARRRRGRARGDWEGSRSSIGEIRASQAPTTRRRSSSTGTSTCSRRSRSSSGRAPPFEPTVRDGWLYGRGVADDKGQLYMLLEAARALARRGELPVNVRVRLRRRGGVGRPLDRRLPRRPTSAAPTRRHLRRRHDRAAACPRSTSRRAGIAYFHVRVRTGRARPALGRLRRRGAERDARALQTLSAVARRATARLPEPLRAGIVRADRRGARGLARARRRAPSELAEQGARPADPRAAEEFYLRTFAEPALDVNGIEGGSPQLQKTVLPVEAEANLSIRLAPGQDVEDDRAGGRAAPARGGARGRRRRDRAAGDVRPPARRPPDERRSSSAWTRSSACSAPGRC